MATRKDLVKKLSENLEYLKIRDSRYAVDCVLDYLKSELIKGNRIEIRGFGSLSVRRRSYPNKNEQYNTIYYRMSKNIKDALE